MAPGRSLYASEKTTDPDGTWRHIRIKLQPLNSAYRDIVLAADDETSGNVSVIAEFISTL